MPRTLAVVGAGWAGLAAAVEGVQAGWAVTLFEMADRAGGRAREVPGEGGVLDNGQHILIGAYVQTLRLMRIVGVDPDAVLLRTPLRLTEPDGRGLHLPAGSPLVAFARGVWQRAGWTLGERIALLRAAAGWAMRGFRCAPQWTVQDLTRGLPVALRRDLIDPLCVAALNTPATDASATVFLRVLRDALFSGPGSADLLLPRASLGALFPTPALTWLQSRGVSLRLSSRVQRLERNGDGWRVDGSPFDAVVLATPPGEAARLTADMAPDWSACAAAFGYEPIVTVYVDAGQTRLPEPMLALPAGPNAPAQFVFDRGQLGGPPGLLAFVISGAQAWVDAGRDATVQATLDQARSTLARQLRGELRLLRSIAEKRATFRCVPGLARPPAQIARGLVAAGDHVEGPYPATLEGAVASAVRAVAQLPVR